MAWAEASGTINRAAEFAARLDGRQVSAELFEQFRSSPEFGRSLTERVDPFLDADSPGDLTLIDAGGEATVFFDPDHQRVIKLFAPPNEGRFELEKWMKLNGWEPWSPPTDQATVAEHTWRRGDYVATDVLPRNVIITEADERLRAIDFIVTRLDSSSS